MKRLYGGQTTTETWGPWARGRARDASMSGGSDGDRMGARGGGSGSRPRWVRIDRIAPRSVITATTRRRSPQRDQVKTSTANTRASEVAHGDNL